MIIKVKCIHYSLDWSYDNDVEIDLDRYVFFHIDYRGSSSWHIVGHAYEDNEWKEKELSDAGVSSIDELARFIAAANAYNNGKWQNCKVSRFNNLHYSGGFYEELAKLLILVKKYEED